MVKADVDRIIKEDRLDNGMVWTIPILLDVLEDMGANISVGDDIALLGPDGRAEGRDASRPLLGPQDGRGPSSPCERVVAS